MSGMREALRGSVPRRAGVGVPWKAGALEQHGPSTPLSVLVRLARRLHEEDVLYCHWKDNDTLAASLRGVVDVDLLVDAAAVPVLTRLLGELGFKPFVPSPWFAYPAIGHFLALDRQTARLTHVHVYYRLITGEGHLKGYHLPWEDAVLASRKLDADHGIYTVDPNVEMVLFLVRSALKLRTYERICRSRAAPCFRGRVLTKFRWLQTRTAAPRVVEVGREVLGDAAGVVLSELLEERPSMRGLLAFRRSVVAALHPHRRYGPVDAAWHRWLKECCSVWRTSNLRRLVPPAPLRLIPATGGRLIAVVGPSTFSPSISAAETAPFRRSAGPCDSPVDGGIGGRPKRAPDPSRGGATAICRIRPRRGCGSPERSGRWCSALRKSRGCAAPGARTREA